MIVGAPQSEYIVSYVLLIRVNGDPSSAWERLVAGLAMVDGVPCEQAVRVVVPVVSALAPLHTGVGRRLKLACDGASNDLDKPDYASGRSRIRTWDLFLVRPCHSRAENAKIPCLQAFIAMQRPPLHCGCGWIGGDPVRFGQQNSAAAQTPRTTHASPAWTSSPSSSRPSTHARTCVTVSQAAVRSSCSSRMSS